MYIGNLIHKEVQEKKILRKFSSIRRAPCCAERAGSVSVKKVIKTFEHYHINKNTRTPHRTYLHFTYDYVDFFLRTPYSTAYSVRRGASICTKVANLSSTYAYKKIFLLIKDVRFFSGDKWACEGAGESRWYVLITVQ